MLRFIATECGSKVEAATVICGASNSQSEDAESHSFIFMRSVPEAREDDTPYFELDDQSQGFHNGVKSVLFTGNLVTVAFAPPPGESFGHRVVIAELRCAKDQIAQFKRGLGIVFRDRPEIVRDA